MFAIISWVIPTLHQAEHHPAAMCCSFIRARTQLMGQGDGHWILRFGPHFPACQSPQACLSLKQRGAKHVGPVAPPPTALHMSHSLQIGGLAHATLTDPPGSWDHHALFRGGGARPRSAGAGLDLRRHLSVDTLWGLHWERQGSGLCCLLSFRKPGIGGTWGNGGGGLVAGLAGDAVTQPDQSGQSLVHVCPTGGVAAAMCLPPSTQGTPSRRTGHPWDSVLLEGKAPCAECCGHGCLVLLGFCGLRPGQPIIKVGAEAGPQKEAR